MPAKNPVPYSIELPYQKTAELTDGNVVATVAPAGYADIAKFDTGLMDKLRAGGRIGTAEIEEGISIRFGDGSVTAPAIAWAGNTNMGFYRIGAANWGMSIAGANEWDVNATRTLLATDHILALRDGALITIQSPSAGQLDLDANTKIRVDAPTIEPTGDILFAVDNTEDIGALGATRPRSGYFGTSVIVGTNPGGVEALRVGGAERLDGSLLWQSDNTYDIGASGATRARTAYLGTKVVVPNVDITAMTSGSVLFAGAGGAVTQDNANFFWDDTNNRLGLGTAPQDQGTLTVRNDSAIPCTFRRDGASDQQVLELRNLTTGAEGVSPMISFFMKDSAGNDTRYGSVMVRIGSPTDTTEGGRFVAQLLQAGVMRDTFEIREDGGLYLFNLAGIERMRLNTTGLGIGGTPSNPLHVTVADDFDMLSLQSTGLNSDAGLAIRNDGRQWLVYVTPGSLDTDSFNVRDQTAGQSVYEIVSGDSHRWKMAGAERMRLNSNGDLGLSGSSFGGGAGVMFIANAATNPTTNPVGGGILYSTGGAGTWRGSGGTVTTFGPAEPHCQRCSSDFCMAWENPAFGKLAVCFKCLSDVLDSLGEKFVIKRGPSWEERIYDLAA